MTIAEEFAEHLRSQVDGTVFASKLPAKPDSEDDQWAVVADGGGPAQGGNFLRWRQQVNLRVQYRHRQTKATYEADAPLSAAVASFQLADGTVIDRQVIPITDTDKDAEGRYTASWQVQLTITIK